MPEPLSPELALVDPDLAARARAALPTPSLGPPPYVRPSPVAPPIEAPPTLHHETTRYPFWARATAAAWLVVLGILIGGAAIPHAQDKPRLVPRGEDTSICKPEPTQTTPRDLAVPRPGP